MKCPPGMGDELGFNPANFSSLMPFPLPGEGATSLKIQIKINTVYCFRIKLGKYKKNHVNTHLDKNQITFKLFVRKNIII